MQTRKGGPRCPSDLGVLLKGLEESPRESPACCVFVICASSSLQPELPLCSSPEKIDVVPIEPHAMFLGIHGGKLCLACVKSGNEIKLGLEVRTRLR